MKGLGALLVKYDADWSCTMRHPQQAGTLVMHDRTLLVCCMHSSHLVPQGLLEAEKQGRYNCPG